MKIPKVIADKEYYWIWVEDGEYWIAKTIIREGEVYAHYGKGEKYSLHMGDMEKIIYTNSDSPASITYGFPWQHQESLEEAQKVLLIGILDKIDFAKQEDAPWL